MNDLILTEKLFPYLWEIDETAHHRMEQLTTKLLEINPVPFFRFSGKEYDKIR